jgi:hypothetical protein
MTEKPENICPHRKPDGYHLTDTCGLNYNCQCIEHLAYVFNHPMKDHTKCPIFLAQGVPVHLVHKKQ